MSLGDLSYAISLFAGIACGFWFGLAQDGEGPFVRIGRWLNKRAARKSLRIMHGALYRCAPELCTPECWE